MDKNKKEKILHDLKRIASAIQQLIKDLDEVGEVVYNEHG